jgi:type II secretory pathway pseudopilin PulG
MMDSSPKPRHDGESGFVLLAAIVLVVLLLISLAVAAPKMARSIQRDKDLETIQRGEQYREAIKLYYQKFGAYPTSVKQLLNTNNMRFLRQEYADPLTGKKDWKPILFGQAHVRPLGFFGKPLSAIGGIAASGVLGAGITPGMYAIEPTSTDANGNPVSGSDTSGNNTAGGLGGGLGASNGPGGGGMFGNEQNGMGSGIGSPVGGPVSTPGLGSPTSSGASAGSGRGNSSTSATTFGAEGTGPIVGFTLPVKKPSLIDYMEQTAYNKWEFNYDPAADQLQQAVSLLGGGATMNNSNSATTALGAGSSLMGSGNGPLGPGATNGNPVMPNPTNPPTTNPQPQNPDNPQQ